MLYDSVKSSIRTVEKIIDETEIKGWRKYNYWDNRVKHLSRKLNRIIHGGGKRKQQRVKKATNDYLRATRRISNKIKLLKKEIEFVKLTPLLLSLLEELNYYEHMLDKHIDLVERRLVKRETIPHEEKIFSIYEPYTEWINKGKSGNRIELGLKIAVCTDQHGFILQHAVMEKQADVEVAIPLVKQLKKNYELESVSFDKGFWSKSNFEELDEIVPTLVLPKKGKRNAIENKREGEKKFKQLRKQHSAVESNINMLEQHGLNRCPDRGLNHFKNYTALGVVAYGIAIPSGQSPSIGEFVEKRENKKVGKTQKQSSLKSKNPPNYNKKNRSEIFSV